MAYTIEASLCTKSISKTVVSTDSDQYRSIALSFGAQVPFLRPSHLSGDHITNKDVIMHALDYYEKHENTLFENVILLQPTSPLRTVNDIENAINNFETSLFPTLASVTGPYLKRHPILMHNISDSDLVMKPIVGINHSVEFYMYNASIYIVNVDYLRRERKLFSAPQSYYVMSKYQIDIDTADDLRIADMLLSNS